MDTGFPSENATTQKMASVAVQNSHHSFRESNMRSSESKPHDTNRLLLVLSLRSSHTGPPQNDANIGSAAPELSRGLDRVPLLGMGVNPRDSAAPQTNGYA